MVGNTASTSRGRGLEGLWSLAGLRPGAEQPTLPTPLVQTSILYSFLQRERCKYSLAHPLEEAEKGPERGKGAWAARPRSLSPLPLLGSQRAGSEDPVPEQVGHQAGHQ